ncbi:galactose oxidase [Hyphomonas sp. WL0036]|uniref:Kelch repeat-containing protein n=1 Tax=Hyphomonas sediminis TaxID=2866160 RepID=UPI001C81651E|nr:kelch repeat-containing protein [Hyphomonas sediminis]MBY9066808.1 galactose oxidase [Hyphomonas sediminis]
MPKSLKFRLSRRQACLGLGAMLATAACARPEGAAGKGNNALRASWSEGDELPFPVQEIYPCLHDGAIHLAGGFIAEDGRITGPTAAHHVWRPDRPDWQAATPLPVARHHPQLVSFGGKLGAFGGYQSSAPERIWESQGTGWWLDAAGERWVTAPALPKPCAEAVMLTGGTGLLHLAGGRSPAGEANAAWADQTDQTHHFVLDGPRGRWQSAAPCPTARNSAAGAEIGGNLHVVGGRSVAGGNTAAHEVYDPREDRWRNAAPMPQAQGGLAAAAAGGKLYAFGGEFFDNGGGVYAEAWVYDPARDNWAAIEPMPHPRHGLGAVTLDGAIYVIGGARKASGNDTSALVEIYRP